MDGIDVKNITNNYEYQDKINRDELDEELKIMGMIQNEFRGIIKDQ
jgi:hypothetical protein